MKFLLSIFIFIYTVFLLSCECVPGINSPKIVEPDEPAFVNFVHALPDKPDLNIKTELKTILNISYDEPKINYESIASGRNNFKLIRTDNSNTIYSRTTELIKDKKYTFIAYGYGNVARELLLNDITDNIDTYFRIAHVSLNAPPVRAEIGDSNDFFLSFRDYTPNNIISSGIYHIRIFAAESDSLLLDIQSVSFSSGSLSTLILRGDYGSNKNPFECKILTTGITQ